MKDDNTDYRGLAAKARKLAIGSGKHRPHFYLMGLAARFDQAADDRDTGSKPSLSDIVKARR